MGISWIRHVRNVLPDPCAPMAFHQVVALLIGGLVSISDTDERTRIDTVAGAFDLCEFAQIVHRLRASSLLLAASVYPEDFVFRGNAKGNSSY